MAGIHRQHRIGALDHVRELADARREVLKDKGVHLDVDIIVYRYICIYVYIYI